MCFETFSGIMNAQCPTRVKCIQNKSTEAKSKLAIRQWHLNGCLMSCDFIAPPHSILQFIHIHYIVLVHS